MGRPNRIQFAGACYHVMLQGNNRQDIFLGNQDRRFFLSLLRGYKDRYNLKVYAYCIMANYVHLLLETAEPNLSKKAACSASESGMPRSWYLNPSPAGLSRAIRRRSL